MASRSATVDVNLSDWDCTLEESAFRPGAASLARHAEMRGVIETRACRPARLPPDQGACPRTAWRLSSTRRGAGYDSVRDVWLRSGLDVGEIERLAAGRRLPLASASTAATRCGRCARWTAGVPPKSCRCSTGPALRLRDNGAGDEAADDAARRACHPRLPLARPVAEGASGLPSCASGSTAPASPPMRSCRRCADGRRVSVAGLVLVRQRPGKGNAHLPDAGGRQGRSPTSSSGERIFERFRPVVMGARFVRVTGKLQSESGVIHIVADKIEDLTPWLAALLEEAAPAGRRSPMQRQGQPKAAGDPQDAGAGGTLPGGAMPKRPGATRSGNVMPKGAEFPVSASDPSSGSTTAKAAIADLSPWRRYPARRHLRAKRLLGSAAACRAAAASSSMSSVPRFRRQHDRDAVAHRIGEPARPARPVRRAPRPRPAAPWSAGRPAVPEA